MKSDWIEGGYFQFKDEKEVQKFIVWLKELEQQHQQELEEQKAKFLEIIGEDEDVNLILNPDKNGASPSDKMPTNVYDEALIGLFGVRNKFRAELREKIKSI